jgi:hypothetical protein
MPTPAAAGGPVNKTCALCGQETTGALCTACVRLPSVGIRAITGILTVTSLLAAALLTAATAWPTPVPPQATCWGCGGYAEPNPDPRGADVCADCAAGRTTR